MKDRINRQTKIPFLEIVYPLLLMLYPMIRVGQGLSVVDTTYSLSNFTFFESMNGTWIIATYLANVLGHALMSLPGGSSLLGINIYTSVLPGLTSVLVFLFLKKEINIHALFVSQIAALGLCWCPTTILYNYLTYLLFTLGALMLYRGALTGKRSYYVAAGAFLGLNVITRLPNVTEAALAVVIIYAGLIDRKKMREIVYDVLVFAAGYIVCFALPLIVICVKYSPSAYTDMIRHLFMMTDKATDYKPASMITAMFEDYLYAFRWILLFAAGFAVCALVFSFVRQKAVRLIAVILSFALIIRICYGQGMFSFRYYEYGSMYFWCVILLFALSILFFIRVIKKDTLALIALIMIYLTCIGSNNGLFPIVNNMFIVLACMAGIIAEELAKAGEGSAQWAGLRYSFLITIGILAAGTLVQSAGFHYKFAFGDGTDGEARDSFVTGYVQTGHIRTTAFNAETLQGLMDRVYSSASEGDTLLTYGQLPGLGYLLDMPSAISTFWPDLDSYNYEEWNEDLKEASPSYIVLSLPAAAWISGDPEAIAYFGEEASKYDSDPKIADLKEFISEHGYVQDYSNDAYVILIAPGT